MFMVDEKDLLLMALLDERKKLKDALSTTGDLAMMEACDRLVERVEHNGWIPAAQFAPEDSGDILMIDEGETVVGYYLSYSKAWFRCGQCGSDDIQVTPEYWMPIPRAPRKESWA